MVFVIPTRRKVRITYMTLYSTKRIMTVIPREKVIIIELYVYLLCLYLSILTILFFLCNNVLIKELLTPNPFRLIHNVLKYASKTKHPRLRSAFTYCEDGSPSRIDFGKSKYGGPFTTEQVEGVKTFFKSYRNSHHCRSKL
jgi:hypothetical protein